MRTSIAAAQEAECERVKADIGRFDAAVTQYASSIYSRRGFFAWATGTEAAVADIGRVRIQGACTAWRRAAAGSTAPG